MPPKPVQPPYARQNKLFVALVAKQLVLKDWDKATLAERMRRDRATLYRRLKDPGELRVDEVRRLRVLLGLTDDEILSLIK